MYFEDKIPATLHVTSPLTLQISGVSYTFEINVFTGDSGSGGAAGVVPAPAAGDASDGKFLSADGTWKVPGVTSNPGGTYGQVQWNDNGTLGGFTLSGDATLDTSTGALTIANAAVTLGKMANLAANSILGNNTGSPATPIALTGAQTTALLSDVVGDSGAGGTKGLVPAPAAGDAAAGKFLKADGTFAVPPGTGIAIGGTNGQIQYNNSGALGGFTMSGDATLDTSTGALTIANDAITLAKMADLAANSILGNNTGSPINPIALTGAQATALLSAMVGDSGSGGTKGLVPAPGAGDAAAGKFLKADGTFAYPVGPGSTINGVAGRFIGTVPAMTDFTWKTQGSATRSQNGGTGTPILMELPTTAGAGTYNTMYKAQPSTPYGIVAYCRSASQAANNGHASGLYFFDGTKFFGIEIITTASAHTLRRIKLTNDTTVSNATNLMNNIYGISNAGLFFQIRNDGSTLYLDYSIDGHNFVNLFNEAIGTFITPTDIAIGGVNVTAGTLNYLSVMSWYQRTDANLN